MRDYSRLAARVFNAPLLATPEAASTVADYLAARLAGESPAGPDAFMTIGLPAAPQDDAPYALDSDGVATIAVHGELVNRGSWMDAKSGLTSYKGLASALNAAAADSRVRGIVLDIDSPGGEAAGALETAALVRAISANKKVVAYVDSVAASAAYAIASGADEIVAPVSARLGSIGVVYMHLDRSQAMKERGVKPTLLHAGAYKVDGNSMQPLPDDARARIQGQIDEVYGLFLDTVGRHRPKLGAEGARRTEAGVFIGQRAVEAGLADRIGGLETLKSAFPRKTLWSAKMPEEKTYAQADLDAAVAAAVAAARTAERERIKAILDGDAAKERAALARHFALATDMSPQDAAAALAAAAPEVAPTNRMSRVPDPAVRPGATQRDVNPQAEIDAGWTKIIKGVAA